MGGGTPRSKERSLLGLGGRQPWRFAGTPPPKMPPEEIRKQRCLCVPPREGLRTLTALEVHLCEKEVTDAGAAALAQLVGLPLSPADLPGDERTVVSRAVTERFAS